MVRKVKGTIETTGIEAATKVGVVITPDQIAASGTEHGHQCALFQWVALYGRLHFRDIDLLHAIPNGGDRGSALAGSKMKAEGVKPGVPDMFLPVPKDWYAGLYIELKVPGLEHKKNGGRSDKQVEWAKRLRVQRYAVVTAYGWKAAVDAIGMYYGSCLVMPFDGDALPVVEMK